MKTTADIQRALIALGKKLTATFAGGRKKAWAPIHFDGGKIDVSDRA